MVKSNTKEIEFKKALPVLQKLLDAGYEAYFVGGSVRDYLLDIPVNDVDIATSAQPSEMKKIFNRTIDLGIEHGTLLILFNNEQYEITTFRTESTYKDHRRPDSVTFVRSLHEDLKRRDFTMNAIAMDVDGQLIDPFSGTEDLENGLIKAVGNPDERFNEDALRMMRAVRFASQLNFTIEKETLQSITENAHLLDKIAVERIQIEFEKLLIGQWRSKGINALITTNLYKYCPELKDKLNVLKEIQTDIRFVDIESAWAYIIYLARKYSPDRKFNATSFLKSWKLSNQLINDANKILLGLEKVTSENQLNEWDIFTLGLTFSIKVDELSKHLGMKSKEKEILDVYENLPIKNDSELDITGYDLMKETDVRPGPWIKEALEFALKKVIYKKIENNNKEIIDYLHEYEYIPRHNQ